MTARRARCRCGAVVATCAGEPIRVSVCHCSDCKRRSGSAFAAQVRFPDDAVTIEGVTREWSCVGESGSRFTHRFCDCCGVAIAYRVDAMPGVTALPIGLFDGPGTLPIPEYSVFEGRKLDWVAITGPVAHFD
ncbi:GFA family protein [Sphingosinithalassobacter portus]|uniref:GFA family protein n=1 Tax=Stakelama portus TaxID=2676234 RepID=UPI000D6E4B44|nr:GFA family protein [Sphingosinithalassobacter portus]